MRGSTIAITVGFLALVGLLIWSMMKQGTVSCDLCIVYQGQTACRSAAAPKKLEAIQDATGRACAAIAHGVTETVACQKVQPSQLRCTGEDKK